MKKDHGQEEKKFQKMEQYSQRKEEGKINDLLFEEEQQISCYREKLKRDEERLQIPAELDMKILSRAAFAIKEREERKRDLKRLLCMAASIVAMACMASIFYGGESVFYRKGYSVTAANREKSLSKKKMAKERRKRGTVREYTEIMENNDAVACDLYSLSTFLDVASSEADLITGYRS